MSNGSWLGRVVLGVALVSGASSGCASESQALAARLESCGLLTPGTLGPSALQGIYAPSACYEQCLAEADCSALSAALCRTSLELLLACDQRCAFRCTDGSIIGIERHCDGTAQCEDRSDEVGCAFDLVCNDGSRVPGARCDGYYNCPSGEDESGCPTTEPLSCDGGRQYVYGWQICDGTASCADGADERGCPQHMCASGRLITYRERDGVRCNGYAQCVDGSDETGCAQLQLMCTGS